MTTLTVFDESGNVQEKLQQDEAITQFLTDQGVLFEQWITLAPEAQDSEAHIFESYRAEIDRICKRGGYQTVDVVSVNEDSPNIAELREKFISEHRHSEDEVRFFVRGEGLFYLHIDNKVVAVHCEAGDLIGVPANTPHWFDMGPEPDFAAIRFFNNPVGWIAHYTGSDIAEQYPYLETA
ncbi:1,2-dihydroxy-3-keto-5-methylthiopentene dioxygenase [Salinibius halmophilus]|uniref:1,2-dihydroxy-3-keto-5-methylthiopentene dioxygenase n=1 Tax=Salinibius halmophilus TaxID=1853216 RepID=UPI000E673DDD|nr:cupin domain-containing protein [Salinibius halmophilus]